MEDSRECPTQNDPRSAKGAAGLTPRALTHRSAPSTPLITRPLRPRLHRRLLSLSLDSLSPDLGESFFRRKPWFQVTDG